MELLDTHDLGGYVNLTLFQLLQDFQLISFLAGKRPFDKPVRMIPLAQG